MNKQAQLESMIKEWRQLEIPLMKRSYGYSVMRLSAVLIAVFLLIYADQSDQPFAYPLAGLMLLCFGVIVHRHQQLKEQLKQYDAMIAVNQKLCRRMDDAWKEETSDSICADEDTVSYDLDLLGPNSLYQYLNFAATPYGKQRLIALLQGKDDDVTAIKQRQEAIAELLKQQDFLLHWESGEIRFAQDAHRFKAADMRVLIDFAKQENAHFPNLFVLISVLMGAITLLFLLLAFLHILPYGYGAVMMLMNMVISIVVYRGAQQSLSFTKDVARLLKDYDRLFAIIQASAFHAPLLQELSAAMRKGQEGLHHLSHLMSVFTLRQNLLSYVLLAALIQLDVPCVAALERWHGQWGKDLEKWLCAVGEMEALVSLSVLAQVKDTWCFPCIEAQEVPTMQVTEGIHPLLPQTRAVANSVTLSAGTWIITGSNMSGKTTFLRTLGIMMMLCRAGAPVCAKAMRTSIMPVYTSMRVKDDVTEGISTFYAELLRMKTMMDASETKQPMLVLIDEIFKGTNSADRILCAETAIKRLHRPWIITLVSTHDFALCACEHDPDIQAHNCHFSEYYVNDEIKFDYRIKEGKATSSNAKELMRLAGIWKEA